MKTPIVTLVVGGMIAVLGTSGAAQHEGHQTLGAAMDPCREQSQEAIGVIDAANRRLELARQTNNPSEMRAAVDALQAALGQIKEQLRPCAAPADAGGAAAGSTPGMQHTAGVAANIESKATPRSEAVAPAPLEITLKSQPSPAKVGDNQFEVTVKDSDGRPISNADVSVLFVMPAMPQMKMPEMRNEVKLKSAGGGKYTGSGQVMTAGQWNVTVSVKQNGKESGQKKFTVAAK